MGLPRYIPDYRYEDYVTWPGDWELLDGIPVSMSPSPGKLHQRACRQLVLQFSRLLSEAGCRECELFFELDWIVSPSTVVRPDLLIVCDPSASTHVDTVPAFIAEVTSDTTRQRDRGYKHELYEQQGVGHYLLVEPENLAQELYRLVSGRYQPVQPGEWLSLHPDCRILWEPLTGAD